MDDKKTLNDLLDGVEHAAQGDHVSVRDVIEEFGERSIMPFILIIALIMISPISGIPGLPTIAATIIILLGAQALWGRKCLWLPEFLLKREVTSARLRKAISWMRKPSRFLDRHTHERLRVLSKRPLRWVGQVAIVLIPLGWPLLEPLPMVTSVGALTVSLLAFGLFTRDGLYLLLGYGVIVLTAGSLLYFLI